MTVKIVTGCLLDAFDKREVDVIGHVVNCQGVQGSGIAKAIKDKFIHEYQYYKEFCNYFISPNDLLGQTQFVPASLTEVTSSKGIYNLFAQLDYGSKTRDLNYGAMGKCLHFMSKDTMGMTVGFPFKMGSDRAKGDWNIVLEMIEFYFKDHDVTIYKLEG